MDPFQLAKLLAEANTPPSGGADLAHYTGQIITWDESTGVNSVMINGAPVSNLRVLQSGIGLQYQPADVVLVEKRMSQWYILGKVAAPGAGAANQIKSAEVLAYETTGSTSYTDLATVGPQVTVTIGSSRRCLVMFAANFSYAGTASNTYIGGRMSFDVTGASSIAAGGTEAVSALLAQTSPAVGLSQTTTREKLLTAADGLNAGVNTFTTRYVSQISSPVMGFKQRIITVIPF